MPRRCKSGLRRPTHLGAPARLSRCRLILPRLAGIGWLPHSAVNAALVCIRCGLSPAVISSVEATSGPTPLIATRSGATAVVMRCRRLPTKALATLTELVLAHLAEGDRSIVPLLAGQITPEEQYGSMMRSRAKIPPTDELRVLAKMLDAAAASDRSRMLAPLPDELVERWQVKVAPEPDAVHAVLAQVST